jgi:AcrR family transcriptional regulator
MGRPRTDIQPRILHAARARFLVDGVDGASLRAIAKDARTSIGMVSYYYATKDVLFLAVVEEVYARLVADLERILGGPPPIRERLEGAFVRIGQASDDEIDVLRLVLREALVSSTRLRDVLARFQVGHLGTLVRALGQAVTGGEIDASIPLPLLVAATLGIGGVPQIVLRIAREVLPGPGFFDVEAAGVAKAAARVLFDGIAPEQEEAMKETSKPPRRSNRPGPRPRRKY